MIKQKRKPNVRGSFNYRNGITLLPFQHYQIKSIWKVSFFHSKILKKFNGSEYEEEIFKYEESFAVTGESPSEAIEKAIEAYEFREKLYAEGEDKRKSEKLEAKSHGEVREANGNER